MISRSMLVALISVLTGVGTMVGVDMDEETKTALLDNLEAILGGVAVVYGIVIGFLRKITSTPLGAGLKGMFVKETQ